MPMQHGVWGIDIGQAALKALRLEMIDDVVTATAFDYVEHPKILSQPDADPDQLTREALEKFLSRNSIKGDHVTVSVPGQSGLARFVKLPPVEEKKIGDIVRFEAKQQIPFPLEEVVWDYQKIGSGEVTDGFAMETEIGLFAMKRDQIARQLAHFQDVSIEVHCIQMAPLALCNFVAYDLLNKGGSPGAEAEAPAEDDGPRGKKRCVVALDIGTDSSNLVITDGEKVIWQRPIPLGGNHLTRALSKELKLTFAKAEHLKRNAAKSPPELKTILSALKPVLTDFVGEVQRSLGFFTNSHRDAQVQYMVGLGSAFRLPGLQKYLSEKLQLDVRKPSRMNRLVGEGVIEAPVFVENVLSFAVPYGLAVQGLGMAKLRTNLLPQEIQKERLIRAKKPWAVAAAAALFLGAGALTMGYALNYRAVSAAPIDAAMKTADSALTEIKSRNSDADAKKNEVEKLTNEVKGVIAGKDEQLNWIRLNEFINRCLPQPDGSNLRSSGKTLDNPARPIDQTQYWKTYEAKEALRQYRERIRGGASADSPLPEEVKENLVLVDIESIESRYTDNLRSFFDNAQRATKVFSGAELAGMLKYDQDNPPKENEAGWVIEIRGYTYQKANRTFLIETLIHNLTFFSRKTRPVVGEAAPATPAGNAPTAAPAAPADPTAPAKGGDPIDDQISHSFLYNYWTVQNPTTGTFQYINQSYLPPLVATPMAVGGPGGDPSASPSTPLPGSGPGFSDAPSALTRDGWMPLTGGGSGGEPTPGSVPGGPGNRMTPGDGVPLPGVAGNRRGGRMGETDGGPSGGGEMRPTAPIPGSPGNPVQIGGDPNATAAALAAKKLRPRYEFVVMFIWREPTPSDALIKNDASTAPTTPSAPSPPTYPSTTPLPKP